MPFGLEFAPLAGQELEPEASPPVAAQVGLVVVLAVLLLVA